MKNLKNNWFNRLMVKFLYRRSCRKLKNHDLTKSYVALTRCLNGKEKSKYPLWQIKIAHKLTRQEMSNRGLN